METPSKKPSYFRYPTRTALVIFWIGASCGGMALLEMYANSAGETLKGPGQWPSQSKLRLSAEGATLILFAHPRCPCTRATLGELEQIVAHFHGKFTPWVIFFKPEKAAEDWDQTDLRSTAAAIPSVQVISDRDGSLARQFHATTSGQTFLYSDKGELLFQGGITASRGHAGDNAGRTAIESCLAHATPQHRQTLVFGCPIAFPSDLLKATK